MTDAPTPAKGSGMAVAALVLGIVAAVTALIPLVGIFLIWVPAILGLIFGIIGMTGGRPKRTLALVGVILAGVSVVIALVTFSVAAAGVKSAVDQAITDSQTSSDSSGTVATPDSGAGGSSSNSANGSTVVYEVTGDGGATSIAYSSYSNGSFGTSTANDATLPWSVTENIGKDSGTFDIKSLTVTAMGDMNTTTMSCKITVDGKVVSEKTSTGAMALVICTAVQ